MIAIATFSSCSSGDQGAPGHGTQAAGEAGAAAEVGAAGTVSSAGGGATANGGADAGPGGVGVAGQDSSGGTNAGGGTSGSGGTSAGAGPETGGGAGMGAGEQLSFCPRLVAAETKAISVTRAYDLAVYLDCRVTWVTNLYLVSGERAAFLQNLFE
jgi:hypothetical protein